MILSPQQQHALDQLLPVGRIATSGIRAGLPVNPRTHTLLIGPSGSGKSFLARKLAQSLGIPCLVINVATWVITASRSEPWTMSSIAEWVDRLQGGGVLVLDEIDKIDSPAEWTRYVRLEIHDVLDGIIPAATKLPIDPPADADFPVPVDTVGGTMTFREILAKKLREEVMVIGCGAWQSAWKANGRAMGFSGSSVPMLPEPPTREQLLASIDAELRQRFRDEVVLLPTMMPTDYSEVARDLARKIPAELLPAWRKELGAALRRAADGSLGMRALEELLLRALLLSGAGRESEYLSEPQALKPAREPENLW